MSKYLILNSLVALGVILNLSIGNAAEIETPIEKQPFADFDRMLPQGAEVSIDRSAITVDSKFYFHGLVGFMKRLPPQITRVSVINQKDLTLGTLREAINTIHDGIEHLRFNLDLPPNSYFFESNSLEKSNDSIVLDVTRLTRLQSLNLDGLGVLPKSKVKSHGHLTFSAKVTGNPIISAVLAGDVVTLKDIQKLPRNSIIKLKSMVMATYDKEYLAHTLTIAPNSLLLLKTMPSGNPRLEAHFADSIKERGCDVRSEEIGQSFFKLAEAKEKEIEDLLGKGFLRLSDAKYHFEDRDYLLMRAAKYGVVRREGVLFSRMIEQCFLKEAERCKEENVKYRQKAELFKAMPTSVAAQDAIYFNPPASRLPDLSVLRGNAKDFVKQAKALKENGSSVDFQRIGRLYMDAARKMEIVINVTLRTYSYYGFEVTESYLLKRDRYIKQAEDYGVMWDGSLVDPKRLYESSLKRARNYEEEEKQFLEIAAKYRPTSVLVADTNSAQASKTAVEVVIPVSTAVP